MSLLRRLLTESRLPSDGIHFVVVPSSAQNPIARHSKFWLSGRGEWVAVKGEHGNAAAELEEFLGPDGFDDFIRIMDEGASGNNVLYFEGTPNRRQMRELRDVAILNRRKLVTDDGREIRL